MNYVQKDINTFSKKHLDLFYKTILKQDLVATQPVKTFITIEIEENSEDKAKSKIKDMCTKLLVNLIIEDFEISKI